MLAAGTIFGRYRILAPLGAGGMGEVYRAHDPRLERDIALKVLPESRTSDETARARLIREARSAAALSHPNICHVYEVDESDDRVYIAMELVEGQPLNERIDGQPLPVDSVIRYGAQIAQALTHAHERHVIHRDLKSGNVMITRDGRVKVLDFGLAKRTWDVDEHGPTQPMVTLTETGVVVGTPHYLAPEVLHGAKADAVSDVWALGVVLYEMAAGELPFRGQTTYELSAAIVNGTPPALPGSVPTGLRRVIERCLAKVPGERTQLAREVSAALDALRTDAGLVPEVTPQVGLFGANPNGKRNSVPVFLTAAGLAAVVLALIAAAWLTRELWLPRPPLREVQITNQSWEIPLDFAALSPDGRMLLCDDWRGLHLMDPATKESHDLPLPVPLRDHSVTYSWRPDSRIFVIGPWGAVEARSGLWEISTLSGKATQIRATGSMPRVSPDGQSLAFINSGDAEKAELWVSDGAGAGAHKLANVTNIEEMCWSPDGKRLAVVEGALLGLTIFDAQRGDRWRAFDTMRFGLWGVGVVWLEPRHLVIAMQDSTVASLMNLYDLRLDASGRRVVGKPRPLTSWQDNDVPALTLTSDHRKLAVLKGWSDMDVYWATLAPGGEKLGELKRLTLENGYKYAVGWTAASDGVFFIPDDGRTFRQSLDSPTAELTDDRYRSSRIRWDGGNWLYGLRRLAITEQFAGTTVQLVRTPVAGGVAEILKEWRLTAHADSTSMGVGFDIPPVAGVEGVVWESVDSALVISRLDSRTGITSEIMRVGWDASKYPVGTLSPDGERLALCTWNSCTIELVDLHLKRISTLRPRPTGARITADSLMAQEIVWLPQGSALLVSTYRPGGLWRVELNGRATRLYASPNSRNPWVGRLQLSPDGRKIALGRLTETRNVWLIEGLK